MAAFKSGFAFLGLDLTLGSVVGVIAMVVMFQSVIFLAQAWLGATAAGGLRILIGGRI